ncbi:MAG TPA: hypothetical protein VE870_07150 [Bacteroidales bacterium]|nr:hypothetical protein [Bacteroidales bacterium]
MNRRNLVYASLVLIIVLILIFVFTGKWKELTNNRPDFAISDTSRVSRIEITGNDTVNLVKKAGEWLVNGTYKANQTAVNNFLFAFNRLEVKGMRKAAGLENESALTVKIWSGRRARQLQFYSSAEGSLMYHRGSEKAYGMEIAGSIATPLSAIITDRPDYWKDKNLVSLAPDQIKRIEVIPAEKWGRGFIIERRGDSLLLENHQEKIIPDSLIDHERLLMYTSYFSHIFYDSTYAGPDAKEILQHEPDYTLRITDMEGKHYMLEMYPKKRPDGETDIFHALVRFNDERQLLVVRYVVLDLLRQTLSHFTVK